MDNRTEQLADGVWWIEAAPYVNVYVLGNDGHGDDDGLTLVDTGLRTSGRRIVESVRAAGLDPRGLRNVLLTHWHPDHAGSAARLARSSAAPSVAVGHDDLPQVREAVPPSAAPGDATRFGRVMARVNTPPDPVADAQGLQDGQVLDHAGGVTVLHTPGHTSGHVAYHLPDRGLLLTGDALFNVGLLSRGPQFFCTALGAQHATLQRIAALPMGTTLGFGHGPPLTMAAAQDRLRRLIERARPRAAASSV